MATHLAELLADQGDTQAACEALDRSVSAWLNASAYHEASQVAARARDLDEARGWAALRRVLVSEARALLWDVANRDATSALAKAKQAWQLQQDEEAATLWAEAATIVSYENPADGEPYGGIDELTSALDAVGTLPLTATTAGYRGFVRLRLSQVASSARRGHARSSVAWLVISVLLDPRQRAWWEQLVWALGQVDARMCALEVARRQLRLAEKEPEALWVMLAATLNQYGTPAAIAPVLSQFQNEDGRSPGDWASALATAQLQAATLAAQLDALPGLISQPPLPDDVLWSVATRAEARALIEAPEWQDALRMAAASEAQALDYGLAARHNLLLGEFDEAVRQCDLAQEVDAGEEAVDVVRQFVRLMGEDPSAEPRLAHYLGRLKCPAQLLSYVNVDLPIMARTARPGWPAAALSRLRQQALARLDVLEKEPVAVPESELRELDESGVLWMLFRLLLIDDDADVSWSFRRRAVEDLEAALSSPVVAASPQDWSGPDLTSVVSQVAGAFLERAARLCLTEVQLLPENEDARGVLAATRELAAALADSDSRREAMAIGALLVAVTDRTSLAQAVSGSGLDEDLSPRQLAGIWSTHVPDAGSWWRLRDVLAATLPGDELAAVEPSLLGRLSQLCGLTEPEQAAERPLQGVLLGSSLVPDDSSEQWVLFTQYVPAMKQRIEERTGCYIPGFRMRFDPVRADAVTYLLNGTVTDFVRLPPDAQARTSPRLDGSSDELGPGQVARSAEIVTSLLQEGAVRHLDLLYGPPDVLRLASAVHVSLSNPAELVYWLDAVRGAIAARCRLPGDEQLATLIRKGWESSLPAEQLTEALRADLPSWSDPAEKDQP
jgi:hypothetical protein